MITPSPLIDLPLIIFDGACGTSLQRMEIPAEAWAGHDGCNELLNLSAPDTVTAMHRAFVDAGATVIETNTFGANRLVLAEFGLADRVDAINRAAVAHARHAIGDRRDVYVCGSIGPGTKLALLGHVPVEDLSAATAEQVAALAEAGVDLLLFETCQDLLQVKTSLAACFDTLARLERQIPVMVSVTIETTGTMLAGCDLATVAATLAPFPLFSLGINCAAGPDEMAGHVAMLSRLWPGRISVMPNAGLPILRDGRTHYPLGPEAFAAAVGDFVTKHGVSIVGGCCGTTAQHIAALRQALTDTHPATRHMPPPAPTVTSAYSTHPLRLEIPPFLIGERLNANGSKAFRDCLLADDLDRALEIAHRQESQGAMALDLCTAYTGRDEAADMAALVTLLRSGVKLPIMIDSTRPEIVETALRLHPGRCIVNSVNLEDGGASLDRICRAARRHGAVVVALTIHEGGMAMTVDEKVATARRILDRAVSRHGLRPEDLLFDALTFTIGSGEETLRGAAVATLEAIRRIKRELPGVGTVLGISNISYGLAPAARKVLNSVFLHEAVSAGLDAAIVDVARIVPTHALDTHMRQAALDLIFNRAPAGGGDALTTFIGLFAGAQDPVMNGGEASSTADGAVARPEVRLAGCILRGDREGLEEPIGELRHVLPATAIVTDILVPAMRRVGRLFADGEMLLPFVLQSAEAMKAAVRVLEPDLEACGARSGPSVLLATVAGDVHDIGKNLVDIILSNNGYTVHNIGIKVPAATIVAKARELKPDVIGLSGLLVKSALLMKENLSEFRAAGLTQPVLLGGAALTADFVARECAPNYDAPVVYCSDAFDGLRALRAFEDGKLAGTQVPEQQAEGSAPARPEPECLLRDNPIPVAPFLGARQVHGIPLAEIVPFVNEKLLFASRWGYRRKGMDPARYEALIRDEVRPRYEALLERMRDESLLAASVSYGYFRATSAGETLSLETPDGPVAFTFPRQGFAPYRCITDFFKTAEAGGDLAGAFVVTVGNKLPEAIEALRLADRFQDYLLLHGLSVELAEGLAECWHRKMRREMGLGETAGTRYAFGYPACPDLAGQRPLLNLLRGDRIGVDLTESFQMVPEQSTSALVVHHPQAHTYAV